MKKKALIVIIPLLISLILTGCKESSSLNNGDFDVSKLPSIAILEKGDEAEAAKLIKRNIVKITNQIDDKTKIVGTGFFIKEGYLLTNSHIVDILGDITIEYHDGTKQNAYLYSNSIKYDLALLKVENIKANALTFSSSESMDITNDVLGAGFIYNFAGEASVSKGILSARRSSDVLTYLQSDISIDSGASGGPLFNSHAGIIGINTFVTENRTFTLSLSSESVELLIQILLDDPNTEYLTTNRPSNAINSILVEVGYTDNKELELYNDSKLIKVSSKEHEDELEKYKENNYDNNKAQEGPKYYCEDGYSLFDKKCFKRTTYNANIRYDECKSGYTKIDDSHCKKTYTEKAKASYYCSGILTENNTCIEKVLQVSGESKSERWGSCPSGKTCYDLGNDRATNTTNKKFVGELICPSGSIKISSTVNYIWNGEELTKSNIKTWNSKEPGAHIAHDPDGTVYYEDTNSVLTMCAKSYDAKNNVYTLYTYDDLKNSACINGGTFKANSNNQGFYCLLSTSIHMYAWDPVCTDSAFSWIKANDTYYCGRYVDEEHKVDPVYNCEKGSMQYDGKTCLIEESYTLSPSYSCNDNDNLQGTLCIKNEIIDAKQTN